MKNNRGLTLIRLIIIIVSIFAIVIVGKLLLKNNKNSKGSVEFSDGTTLIWKELKNVNNAKKYGYNESSIGNTDIGEKAFRYCENLTSITIPSDITSIGSFAFKDCQELRSVKIPNSVTYIGYSAFSGCTNLTSIKIPDSIDTINHYAFDNTGLKNVEIPNSVICIEDSAFFNCEDLECISIPKSVTKIGEGAFGYCENLKCVIYNGKEYTSISEFKSAFNKQIDEVAFYHTNLSE